MRICRRSARSPGLRFHAVSARDQEIAGKPQASSARPSLRRFPGVGARSGRRYRRRHRESARTPRHRAGGACRGQARLLRMAAGPRPGRNARKWRQRQRRPGCMSRSGCRAQTALACAMQRSWYATAPSGAHSVCGWCRPPPAGVPNPRHSMPICRTSGTAPRSPRSPAATRSPRSRRWSAPIPM